MTLSRGSRRLIYALAALAVLGIAIIVAAPPVVRGLALHYLAAKGVDARIDDVDVNLFTGHLEIHDAHGQAEAGDGFEIGRLALSIDYAPLLSHQLRITRLTLADTRIDIRRTADNTLRVGGVPVLTGAPGAGLDWGVALERLAVDGLALHYRQAAQGDQPAIDREIVLNQSDARDIVTWQQDNEVPLDADLAVGDSRLRVTGRVVPFGRRIEAHFEIETDNLALDLLAPVARASGLKALTGRVDGHHTLDLTYAADDALTLDLDGDAAWRDSRLALASGFALASDRFDWNGTTRLRLLRADGQPGAVTIDGTAKAENLALDAGPSTQLSQAEAHWQGQTAIKLAADATHVTTDGTLRAGKTQLEAGPQTRVRAASFVHKGKTRARLGAASGEPDRIETDDDLQVTNLHVAGPSDFALDQPSARWQGTTTTTLGADRIRVASDGRLTGGAVTIAAAGGTRIDAPGLDWQGQTTTTVGANAIEVDSDGQLVAERLALHAPASLDIQASAFDWSGGTKTVVDDDTLRTDSHGRLSARALDFDIPDTASFSSDTVDWAGDFALDLSGAVPHEASGRLVTANARLDLPATPLAVTAERMVFDGHYGQQPAGDALHLTVTGDVDAHELAIMNTGIGAAWASAIQAHAGGIAIDGTDDIAFERLETSGLRLLGDTDTDAAVLQAVKASARNFALRDLLHYHVADIDIDEADIHVRRDADGMGVIARYLGGADDAHAGNATTGSDSPPATYAVDNLTLAGPRIVFTDVAVNPPVRLSGSALDFVLHGMDTATRSAGARYRLSLDVGAYGHLDSIGTVSPLAPEGLDMDARAWLRSLALGPLSGYLQAAMERGIAGGVADGTLELAAKNGQLDGNLDTSLTNFRLADSPKETEIALGINMATALKLIRGQDDTIHFATAILGDVTNPYFSVRNLVREAVLAGVRTALLSDFSPVGLLNRAKNAVLNQFRSVEGRPAVFRAGMYYVQPGDRRYLARVAQAMSTHPDWRLTVQPHATPADSRAMADNRNDPTATEEPMPPAELARRRARAVRDYLAARNVMPEQIELREPVIDDSDEAGPRATFTLDKDGAR